MASDSTPIAEQGVATLSDKAWAQARHRTDIIRPLAALEVVGHEAADTAAQALGLSRRQVYVLIHRARQGTGLLTDLAPGRSGGGKGKGRLPEPVERIIRELLHKRFLTKQKRSLAAVHREVAQACKAQQLRMPARNTVARRIADFDPMRTVRSREVWEANDAYCSLLASFAASLPLRRHSPIATPDMARYLLTRSEGTIGELAHLLMAAAVAAVESGEEAINHRTLSMADYIGPGERRRQFERELM